MRHITFCWGFKNGLLEGGGGQKLCFEKEDVLSVHFQVAETGPERSVLGRPV